MRVLLLLILFTVSVFNTIHADENSTNTNQLAVDAIEESILFLDKRIILNRLSIHDIHSTIAELDHKLRHTEIEKSAQKHVFGISVSVPVLAFMWSKSRKILRLAPSQTAKKITLWASGIGLGGTVGSGIQIVLNHATAVLLKKELHIQIIRYKEVKARYQVNLTHWCHLHDKLANTKEVEVAQKVSEICNRHHQELKNQKER